MRLNRMLWATGVVAVVAAMLTIFTYGSKAPPPVLPTFTNGVCAVPQSPPPGARAASRFWLRFTGAERMALSTEADGRVGGVFARVVASARRHGFRFEAPSVRVTKPELALLLGPGISYVFAIHYAGPRMILVNGWWAEQMDDSDLEYVLAHELAHAIDLQNERRGHRFLERFTDTDDEDLVADVLAMLIVSPRGVFRFENRYQRPFGHTER